MIEDRIISVLIGLVRACNNNPKTAATDSLVVKALAFPLLCPNCGDKAVNEIINEIRTEKNSVAPAVLFVQPRAEIHRIMICAVFMRLTSILP